MASQLVIVESPSKVAKIQKFLGDTYKVSSSKGHIRNLGKGQSKRSAQQAAALAALRQLGIEH